MSMRPCLLIGMSGKYTMEVLDRAAFADDALQAEIKKLRLAIQFDFVTCLPDQPNSGNGPPVPS